MKHLLHLLLIYGATYSLAQNTASIPAGARGASMANASVTFSDVNSIFANQAGLTNIQESSAIAFAEQRFFISELQTVSFGAALPTPSGTFAIAIHHFGFEGFKEQKFGLAYARKLLPSLSLGSQILLLNTSIPEYGNNINVTFELGMISYLSPTLQLAAHIYSPVQVELANGEQIPTVFKLGLSYLPSSKLTCTAEVEKDIDFPVRVKFGLEYQIVEQILIRTGIATHPTLLAFGVGYRLKSSLTMDIAASYHQTLGFTPTAGFIYNFKKNK